MTDAALVLVADDDPAMRGMLGASLRRRGFDVTECNDGRQLLQLLEKDRDESRTPSLVVSDLRMPGVTGLDVLHWCARWLPQVPVILITAFGDDQTHRRARALGAAFVIDKPFDLDQFHAHVSAVLAEDEPDIPA